jgi:site-specific recombinase XerC
MRNRHRQHPAERAVERLRKRVVGDPDERDENITPEDRNALIRFDEKFSAERKKNGRAGWAHHRNKLRDLIVFASETQCLADTLEDGPTGEQALQEIVDWILDQGASEYTVQGNLSTLRIFAETLLGELPERFAEIEPSAHVDEDPAPLPSNIVEYQDLLAMVDVTDCTRDRALMTTQWGAGFRPMGELWTLQYKHVDIRDGYVMITLEQEGKTERHEVAITVGAPFLRKWILEEHPVHDDPEASLGPETYIWTRKNRNTLLSYGALGERFNVAGEKAGIEKDHSPQHFRRSCASILARQPGTGLTDLMQRFSWARASNAPWHYIAAHSNPTNLKVLQSRGHDIENLHDEPEVAPIVCPDCGDWTMRGLDECIWCHRDLDPEQTTWERPTREDPRSAGEKSLAEMILDGDITADELRTLRKLEAPIKTKRDLFEELDELIVKAEALEEAKATSGDSVSSLFGITGLVGWASTAATSVTRRWAAAKHAALKIHPGFEHYPPSGKRLAGLLAGWALILGVAIPLWLSTGIPQEAAAGKPTAVVAAVVAIAFGVWFVNRDTPTIDDALHAAVEE